MKLSIVGLRTTGTLVGLALKAATSEIPVMGHDPDPERVKRASRLGAIDKSHWNLLTACDGADLILLDLSLDQMEPTLAALNDELGEKTVLLDTCPIKRPVVEIAQRVLSAPSRFVGGHLVTRTSGGNGEAFDVAAVKKAAFYLVALPDTAPDALDMAANLALAIGAKPQFVDAAEHDGLVAATSQLVLLSALVLADTLTDQHGERDRQGAVGAEYAALALVLSQTQMTPLELLSNRDNLVRWFDALSARWATWRRALVDDDKALGDKVERVTAVCDEWLQGEATEPEAEPTLGWREMLLGRRSPRER